MPFEFVLRVHMTPPASSMSCKRTIYKWVFYYIKTFAFDDGRCESKFKRHLLHGPQCVPPNINAGQVYKGYFAFK